jgi:hypothetical protein
LLNREKKIVMEKVQESILKKRKGTRDEDILWTAKEWIPNPRPNKDKGDKILLLR